MLKINRVVAGSLKTMKQTELKHWVNGHQIRGNHFHSISWQILKLGFLLSIQLRGKKYFNFELFKLI